MGRCYAFGPSLTAGCEHAMVVGTEGACVCEVCGVRCGGQFAACGPILQKPGWHPATAPSWALEPGLDRDPASPATAGEHEQSEAEGSAQPVATAPDRATSGKESIQTNGHQPASPIVADVPDVAELLGAQVDQLSEEVRAMR